MEYDQVNNEQREIIYEERRRVLNGENMQGAIQKMIKDVIGRFVHMSVGEVHDNSEWDLQELNSRLLPIIPLQPITHEDIAALKNANELTDYLVQKAQELYQEKEKQFPTPEEMREIERVIILKVIDRKWMDHIDDMDQLRQGIGLQAYGQRDPLVEFKTIGYEMFGEMTENIQMDTLRLLYHVRVEEKVEREEVAKVTGTNKDESLAKAPKKRSEDKIYPNDPCPCGSGKKYKQCCGRKK